MTTCEYCCNTSGATAEHALVHAILGLPLVKGTKVCEWCGETVVLGRTRLCDECRLWRGACQPLWLGKAYRELGYGDPPFTEYWRNLLGPLDRVIKPL